MIKLALRQRFDNFFERGPKHVLAPVAVPVHISGDALGRQFGQRQLWQRTKMDIGDMSEPKHESSLTGAGLARQAGKVAPLGPDDEYGGRPPEMRSWRSRLITRIVHTWFAFTRSMTLGVRAACFDADGRVFLLRHSYVPGWHMPGGGVERGQTAEEALRRELMEEGNLEVEGGLELRAVYFNPRTSKRDHVVFYRCQVRQLTPKLPDMEILEAGFFALDDLPNGVTAATRRRLNEIAGIEEPDSVW